MAKRPRFLRPVGRIGSSVETIAIVCREQRLRDHEEFVRTHDTTVNVVVTEDDLFIQKLERVRIQSSLKLCVCLFGEWKVIQHYNQELLRALDEAGVRWRFK